MIDEKQILPFNFFSYGGTALAVNLGEMGIVLNISRKRTIQEANT